MNNILLDSSVIVDFLRVKEKQSTLLKKLIEIADQLYIPIIGHTELFAGKSVWGNPRAREDLQNILSGIEILPLDEDLSEKAGAIRAEYNIHIVDSIIAATAIKHKLELATLNIKDFKKVRGLKILQYPMEN